jgi:hypothetical protein
MGTDESGQQAVTAATDGGEVARRRHPVVSGLFLVAFVALFAGAVALIWFLVIVAGLRSGPQDGPYVVNATDRTVTVEQGTRYHDGYRWGAIVELGPGERKSVVIACPGQAQVRALNLDGELVAATELEAEEDCSGEWIIEARG